VIRFRASLFLGANADLNKIRAKQIKSFQKKWLLEIRGQPIQGENLNDPHELAHPENTYRMKNAVLSGLIMTLMQKNVLTQIEGKDLLRRVFRD